MRTDKLTMKYSVNSATAEELRGVLLALEGRVVDVGEQDNEYNSKQIPLCNAINTCRATAPVEVAVYSRRVVLLLHSCSLSWCTAAVPLLLLLL